MDKYNRERLAQLSAWVEQPLLFEMVLATLSRHDPMGLYSPANPHAGTEYATEVETILPHLPTVRSVAALRCILEEEFERWFRGCPIPPQGLALIAQEIWQELRNKTESESPKAEN